MDRGGRTAKWSVVIAQNENHTGAETRLGPAPV